MANPWLEMITRKFLEKLPKPWLVGAIVISMLAVGVADYVTGAADSAPLFYLIPISLAAWFIGRWPGIAAAFGCGVISFFANSIMPARPSISGVDYWNAGMRMGAFLIFALILASVKRMLDSLEQERIRTRELASQVICAQEEERKRIARELHDEASQALTGLSLRIEKMKLLAEQSPIKGPVRAEDLEELKELTKQIHLEIRRLAVNLRPAMLENLGLGHALAALFRDQLKNRGIEVVFRSSEREFRLPPEIELALYRVTQEAVANIVKYSKASAVTAALVLTEKNLELELSDNGIGFDPQSLNDKGGPHLGISGMMERVSLLSGTFHLVSKPGGGTAISLSIPLVFLPAQRNITQQSENVAAGVP